MNAHLDDLRLHDYLDGELVHADRAQVEAHASACTRCAERLADLAEVRSVLGALPREAKPATDLWPAIRRRIEAGPDVVPLPGTRPVRAEGAAVRARAVPAPLAYAAGLILAFAAGALTFAAAGRDGGAGTAVTVEQTVPDQPLEPGRLVAAEYEEAISDLEGLLEAGRDRLDPVTVRALEESLATIDRAIADAESALAADPESALIRGMLLNQRRAKYRVLSRAADALLARS